MKPSTILSYIFFLSFSFSLLKASEECKVILEPTWQNLDQGSLHKSFFQDQRILVGRVIFRKRIKEPVGLSHLTFQWHGKQINFLLGSLYRYNFDNKFMPIEDNLLGDSCWNRSKQRLIFNFEEKHTLGATTIFYLVLMVPESLEETLRDGYFTIEKDSLPRAFQEAVETNQPSLSLNKPNLYTQILPQVAISYPKPRPVMYVVNRQ